VTTERLAQDVDVGPPSRPVPLWREGYRLIRANPQTMLPLLVTQLPLSIGAAAAWIILFAVAYPDVSVDSGTLFASDAPRGLILWVVIISWSHALFTTVGISAAIIAVRRVTLNRPQSVTESLDPPFTRLGGLLLIFGVFQGLLLAGAALTVTIIGAVLALYVALRLGLVLHAFILEGLSTGRALRRSWSLMRGNVFRYLGALFMVVPVMLVTLTFASVLLVLVLLPFLSEDPGRTVSLVSNAGVFLALGLCLVPTGTFFAALTTLFYLRIGGENHE
jgi:hypothetical protein